MQAGPAYEYFRHSLDRVLIRKPVDQWTGTQVLHPDGQWVPVHVNWFGESLTKLTDAQAQEFAREYTGGRADLAA